MIGQWGTVCRECGADVFLSDPLYVDEASITDEASHADAATIRGTCSRCRSPASTVGPVVLMGPSRCCVILNLSVRHKLPAASLVDILDDLVNGLPEAAPDSLTVYATYDHFALDRDRPDIYSTAELGDFIGRDVAEEEIYLLDLANDMIQNGEALEALEHCCRAVSSIPDLLNTRWVKENLSLMCAFARLSGADGARLASCTAFLASHLDPAQENDGHAVEVRWKVPSAFGPDAPLISGVPAGYLVPEVYVQRGSLSPDESAMVYFLLLLFSSALRRQAAPVSELQHLRHLLIQAKFSRTWKEASPECREHLTEIYRHVSGGSSLTEVVESLGEVP